MKGESAKQATDMLNPTKLWKGSSELMYIIIVKRHMIIPMKFQCVDRSKNNKLVPLFV